MKQVANKGAQQEIYEGRNIKGISLGMYIKNATANLAFAADLHDLSAAFLRVTKKWKGGSIEICNNTLRNLVMLSEYDTEIGTYVVDKTKSQLLVAHGVGISAEVLVPLRFDFGTVLNLKGSEQLEVELRTSGVFGTEADTASSYIEFDAYDGIGYENFTPVFKTRPIEANKSSLSETIGDNIQEVILANFDKTSILDADAVVSDIRIASDKLNQSWNYYELLNQRAATFIDDLSNKRYQSHVLYSGNTELHSVRVEGSLVAGNVNADKNVLLIRSFVTSPDQVAKALVRAEKHRQENARRFRPSPSTLVAEAKKARLTRKA